MPQKRCNDLSFVECVWQPVPNNGHDTAERPVAPFTSACCLCSHGIQRSGENKARCVRGERVSVDIVSTDWSCFCVQFSSLTLLGRGRSIYYRRDP